TSMEAAATSKARPPARGKPSHISAVIKSTQRARVRSRLSVKARTTVEPVAVTGVCAVKVATAETPTANAAVIEITMMESVVSEVSAVRDIGVMVEECSTAMPVVSPVAPSPPKPSEISDSKSKTERESDAAPKNTGHRIPARVGDDWRAIHQPRIVGRHIDHVWTSRLDD